MLNRGVEATKFDVKDKSCIYYLIIMKLYNLLNITKKYEKIDTYYYRNLFAYDAFVR